MQEIERYIGGLPEVRRDRGGRLHELIVRLFPDAEVNMYYKMPTYRRGENVLAWGSQKKYLSVYTCSAEQIAQFKSQHPQVSTGSGCLKLRDRDKLPIEDLERVVANALAPPDALLQRETALRAESRKSGRR